jgi:hypothetical protein
MRFISLALGAFVASVLALALAGVALWRLRCEGFGCVGIGVAWLAWVAIFMVVLAGGLALLSRPSLGQFGARATKGALIGQAILALVAIAAWLTKSAP